MNPRSPTRRQSQRPQAAVAHLERSTKKELMRVELPVCDASEPATAKEKTEVCRASGAHFRPFNVGREFFRAENASAGFTLGSQLLLQQFPRVVTSISNQEKLAARFSIPLEPESNQALQPTAASGRG